MQHSAILSSRAVIALSGADTRAFLQGLVTNDVSQFPPGKAVYAALLTPQGKILFDFFIVETAADGFYLDCAAATSVDLLKRLRLYRLRAKVEIAARPDLAVAALWDGAADAANGDLAYPDPRHPALGLRIIARRAELDAYAGPESAYRLHRLSLGVPDSADLPADSVFALDAGLEELSGVSFKKGCYVGQEVTARMKHRATARRRFLLAEGPAPLPAGTAVRADGRDIGALASGEATLALALIRLDRLAEAEAGHAPITAGGAPVVLRKPDWLKV